MQHVTRWGGESRDAHDKEAGVRLVVTRGDRLAIAGFVCSASVLVVEVLLILIMTVPALHNTAGDIVVLLLVVGAILWVAGLLLSIRAGKDAPRHHRLAKAGTTVSVITAALFLAGVVAWFVLVVVWFLTDPFAVGMESWGAAPTG